MAKRLATHCAVGVRMKSGDLVRLNRGDYPQYRHHFGILIQECHPDMWQVHIKGRLHPYLVHKVSLMEVQIKNGNR